MLLSTTTYVFMDSLLIWNDGWIQDAVFLQFNKFWVLNYIIASLLASTHMYFFVEKKRK